MALTGGSNIHLLPGFRFQPTDQEIIHYYLDQKVSGRQTCGLVHIPETDVYACHPSNLIPSGETHTYCYTYLAAKNGSTKRINRVVAGGGTWKSNGNATPIFDDAKRIIGSKLLLTFHAEGSRKASGYVMHEYALSCEAKSKWVLCLVKLSPQKEKEIKKKMFEEAMAMRGRGGRPLAFPPEPPPPPAGWRCSEGVDESLC